MTLKTWMDEFYPVAADDCPKEQAIEHSLLKWQGLTKESKAKHKVAGNSALESADYEQTYNPADVERFYVNCDTCALCQHYFEAGYAGCNACPLYAVRGKPCDRALDNESLSPWHAYTWQVNPFPMIELLQKALDDKHKA